MTPSLEEAKLILRGKRSADMYAIAQAAVVVLEHAEDMERRAWRLHAASDPGERRDAVLENIREACSYILGEVTSVGLARRLVERNAQ